MVTSKHRHEPPEKQGRPATVEISTVNSRHNIFSHRSGKGRFEFVDTLEVNDSGEAESKIQVGKWIWWRFEEGGKEDNNMGLPLAILRYTSGYYEVAVLRGVEVPEERPSRRHHQTRVVCSPDCWIIEIENIGSAVTEEETKGEREACGRVETRNSRGQRFSLDRYHFLPRHAHATSPLLIDNIVFDSMVGMQYCLKLGLDPLASSLPEPLNSNRRVENHAVKRVVNPLGPENGLEAEPNANLDAAEQSAGPNAEWTLCQRQNVMPGADYAAETRETQVRKTSLVSALTPEALSNDDDDDEIMPLAGHRASNEAETMKGVVRANDMPEEAANEPHLEQDLELRPSQLFQNLEADSRARTDERFLDKNCTTQVPDTFENRAVHAINSSPDEPQGSILADELESDSEMMDNDRQENDVMDLTLLQDGYNTDPGVESEPDFLLDGALKSLEGANEMSTTAILTTLTSLNIHPHIWLVVDPGSFEWESSHLPSLRDTHRYLITVVNAGNHWTAAVIDRESGRVDIYDPLQQEDFFRSAWSLLQPLLAHMDKHLPMQQNGSPSWQPQKVQCQLQQQDLSNCGVYATVYCIYRLHGLELPQDIYPSSWRRAFVGVLAASNDVELPTIRRRRTLKDFAEDLATFLEKMKNDQPQAESEQLLKICTLLENTMEQLALTRTALEKEEESLYQRLKKNDLLTTSTRFSIGPSKAETAINKVVAMIREDYHQADAELKAKQDLALDMERIYQEEMERLYQEGMERLRLYQEEMERLRLY
ncbi:hypothetical protein NU219Hw_g4874t1 [Hortaea werneckii]